MKISGENEKASLGRRIRTLRKAKRWTQEELGKQADVSYKFPGEIERGIQNPSFTILVKVANALGVKLSELFRFESEGLNRKAIETSLSDIIKNLPDDEIGRVLKMLRSLYPVQ